MITLEAEIVDLLNPNQTCQFENKVLDNCNAAKWASVGGYMYKSPIICGGGSGNPETTSNKCLHSDTEIEMLQFRQYYT